MSRYQDVQAVRVLSLRGVFYIFNLVVIFSTSAMVVLYLCRHIVHVIDSQGRLKKRPANGSRALGFIATYAMFMRTVHEFAFMSDRISRFKVNISIYLVYNIIRYGLLTRRVQTVLTRNRREAGLTGMKRMVASFDLSMYCQGGLQTQLWHELAKTYSFFVMRGWRTFLMLPIWMLALLLSLKRSFTLRDLIDFPFPCFRTKQRSWVEVLKGVNLLQGIWITALWSGGEGWVEEILLFCSSILAFRFLGWVEMKLGWGVWC